MSEDLTPNFIIDRPADEDAFGAHDRVASALTKVVLESKSVRMIALLGGWGSGKSTVVGMVEKKLSAPTLNIPVVTYTYDTWLRQSDPPRRALLEGLLEFVKTHENLCVNNNDIKLVTEELEKLKGATEITNTNSSVKLSDSARAILPLLLLAGLGLKLTEDGAFGAKHLSETAQIWLWAAGWALMLFLPIRVFWLRISKKVSFTDMISLFHNEPGKNVVEIKNKAPEPSAIEFRQRFLEISRIIAGKGHRLVLIIDNLDRLPVAEAVTLWASLRAFLFESNSSGEEEFQPVIIVPLDANAAGKIHVNDKEDKLSKAFVEKTFDVVFHVPAPVLSGWQSYLRKSMQAVFEDRITVENINHVIAVYEGFHRGETERAATTPRKINSFVNSLAVLQMQWKELPLASIAYFVCNHDVASTEVITELKSEVNCLEGFDKDWRTSLTVLRYGVPKDMAEELYMFDAIQDDLKKGHVDRLKRLAELSVFETYLDRVTLQMTVEMLEPSVLTLAHAFPENNGPSKRAWTRLQVLAKNHMALYPLSERTADVVKTLIEFTPAGARQDFVRQLGVGWGNANPDQLSIEDGAYLGAVIEVLVSNAQALKLSDFEVRIPNEMELYIRLLAQPLALETHRAISSPQPLANIIGVLGAKLGMEPEAEKAERAIRVLWQLSQGANQWAALQEPLQSAMNGSAGEGPKISAAALNTAAFLTGRVPEAGTWLRANIDNSWVAQAWQRLSPALPSERCAAPIALLIHASHPVSPWAGGDWAEFLSSRPNLPHLVDEELKRLDGSDDLNLLVQRWHTLPVLQPVLRIVAMSRILGNEKKFATEFALELFPSVEEVLPAAEAVAFWRACAEREGFFEMLAGRPLNYAIRFYSALSENAAGKKGALKSALLQRINMVSQQEWGSAVRSDEDPFSLLDCYERVGGKDSILSDQFESALIEMTGHIAQEGQSVQLERWQALAERLTPDRRKGLMRPLLFAASQPNTATLSVVRWAGASEVFKVEQTIDERSTTRTLVLRLLTSEPGAEWLGSCSHDIERWIGSLSLLEAGDLEYALLGDTQGIPSRGREIILEIVRTRLLRARQEEAESHE